MSILSSLLSKFKPLVEEDDTKIALFNLFFSIGDQKISGIVKSEFDARQQIERINTILNTENGFYNHYSVLRDGRILFYISLNYPSLRYTTSLLLSNFKMQNYNVYNKFMESDGDIKNKFTMGGIISDMYKIEDDYINLLENIHNFDPIDNYETIRDKNIKNTREFLLTPICFTKDGKIVETLTIYDMVCWYFANWMRESPIINHTQKSLEDINEINKTTYPLFIEQIKTRYGVGGKSNE